MSQLNDLPFYLPSPYSEHLQCEVYEEVKFVYGETQNDVVESYGICLTPVCYLYQKKADYIKFVQLIDLGTFIVKCSGNTKADAIRNIVRNSIPRYHFLPQSNNLPDSIIDFQRIASLSIQNFIQKKYASISSPYAEAILNRYCTYSMRIGTPDYFQNHKTRILQKYLPV